MTCSERNLGEEAEMTTTRGSKSEIELRNGCGNPGRVKEHWRGGMCCLSYSSFLLPLGVFFCCCCSTIHPEDGAGCVYPMLDANSTLFSFISLSGWGPSLSFGKLSVCSFSVLSFFCINPYMDTPWSSAGVYLHYFTPAPVAGRSLFRCSPVGGWRFALFRGVRLIIAGFPLAGKEGKKQALGPRGVVMRF